jgi:ABC-type transport system involved in Fe-S cluster assembly fused permease/ATPase subunit
MLSFLLEILVNVLLFREKSSWKYAAVLAVIILGYALFTFITKSEFSN